MVAAERKRKLTDETIHGINANQIKAGSITCSMIGGILCAPRQSWLRRKLNALRYCWYHLKRS